MLPYKGFGNLFPQVEPFADPFENPSGTLRTRRNPSQWAGPFAVPLLLVGGTSVAVSP